MANQDLTTVAAQPPLARLPAISAYLRQLCEHRWHGNFNLRFDAGSIVLLRSGQSIRPEDLSQYLNSPVERPGAPMERIVKESTNNNNVPPTGTP